MHCNVGGSERVFRFLCLGLDVKLIRPVIYRRHRTPFDPALRRRRARTSPHGKLACTKFSRWHYENKARVFAALDERDQESGLFFAPFSPTMALCEMIVGAGADVGRAELGEAVGVPVPKSGKVAVSRRIVFNDLAIFRGYISLNQNDYQLFWLRMPRRSMRLC